MTEHEFWSSTPFEIYIENQAAELKVRRDNVVNIQLLNAVLSFGGGDSVNFDDLFGYLQAKDLNFLSPKDFTENGEFDREGYKKYLKETVIPTKKERGI